MNCEFFIEKENFPDTKIILVSYIESAFNLKVNIQKDKLSLFDMTGDEIMLNENSLEDIKDALPEKIKVHISKSVCKNDEMNDNQIDNLLNELEFGNFTDITREKSMAIGKYDEVEVFNKLLEFVKVNNTNLPSDLEDYLSSKNYSQQFHELWKWILDVKTFNYNLTEKMKFLEGDIKVKSEELKKATNALEEHKKCIREKSSLLEENKMLQSNYMELKNSFNKLQLELKTVISKSENDVLEKKNQDSSDLVLKQKIVSLQKALDEYVVKEKNMREVSKNLSKIFISDVKSNYLPSNNFSLIDENIIQDFYNDLVFQAKQSLGGDLNTVRDFLDSNSGMVGMILESSKYKKCNGLTKVDTRLLESEVIKEKCEAFSIFIQNVLNVFEA